MIPSPARNRQWLPPAMILLIGVCYAVISSSLSYLGDDLAYFTRSKEYAGGRFYLFYKLVAGVWTGSNGRLQNVICPAMFQYLPGVCVWALNGAMTALLFFMTVKWSGVRSTWGRLSVITVMTVTLPWWDMFLLYVVSVGYVWNMAIVLSFLWLFLECRRLPGSVWGKIGLAFLSFLAGGMHEASAVPLAVSLAVYLYFTGRFRDIGSPRRWMLGGGALGLLYCIASPAIWSRLGSESAADGEWWWLLCHSSSLVILLVLVMAAAWIWRRDAVRRLVPTPWSVMVMMSLMSLPIVVAGGIVGRAGFFGQVSALIAVCQLLRLMWPGLRVNKILNVALSVVLSAALAFHYIQFTRVQLRLNDEVRSALNDYSKSPDGAVYLDFTNEPDLPWYLLRKTRGVPDEDDFYLTTSITRCLGTADRPFTVLPSGLREADIDTLTADLPVGKGYVTLRTLGREMPDSGGRRLISAPGVPDSIAVPLPVGRPAAQKRDGKPATVSDSASAQPRRVWYVTARDFDPSGSY